MGDGFQFMDIIFFGMVAAFLVLRLYSVLGKRTGNERPPGEPYSPSTGQRGPVRPERGNGNVVELPERPRTVLDAEADELAISAHPAGGGITQIRLADPAFTPEGFLQGAKMAFEMILKAYADGNEAALRPLLAEDVFRNFAQAIDERRRAGEQHETELVHIKSADIVEAGMQGRIARVTIKFFTEQVLVVRDKAGQIVDGDPNRVTKVTDIWTFSRDTRARDPNWQLVETRSPDA